jgi:hypothetical protein
MGYIATPVETDRISLSLELETAYLSQDCDGENP